MLVSHRYQFIFLKTKKTASTTTEIFFERFCLPGGFDYKEEHHRHQLVTEAGIIGSRGSGKDEYYNHMPAAELKEKLGAAIFDSYIKIANVRNPFDSLVSDFYFNKPDMGFEEYVLRKDKKDFEENLAIIFLNGQSVVDVVIRYENLQADIEAACEQLQIPFELSRIGQYKTEFRKEKKPYRDYYNSTTRAVVEKHYGEYMNLFGYQF